MSDGTLVLLIMLGGIAIVAVLALVVWRLFFRELYPNCTCVICGRRRR